VAPWWPRGGPDGPLVGPVAPWWARGGPVAPWLAPWPPWLARWPRGGPWWSVVARGGPGGHVVLVLVYQYGLCHKPMCRWIMVLVWVIGFGL